MYAVAKTTNPDDRASWVYMDAAGDFGRIEDARLYDDVETARGVARVMWWEAREEERVFVVDLKTDEITRPAFGDVLQVGPVAVLGLLHPIAKSPQPRKTECPSS